jgi:hypothetical protein
MDSSFQGDEAATQCLALSSLGQPYYAPSMTMPEQAVPYPSHHSPLPSTQSWLSVPLFRQRLDSFDSGLPSNNLYTGMDINAFSPAGKVVPPMPQSSKPTSFLDGPSLQQSYLPSTTSSNSNSYSSHESNSTSISSLSRSCSPAPLTCTASSGAFAYCTSPKLAECQKSEMERSQSISRPDQTSPPPQPRSLYQSAPNSFHPYGIQVTNTSPSGVQTWRCAYPACSSRALFTRGCDLRKHFNRHSKHLFCRFKGCAQSAAKVQESARDKANSWENRKAGSVPGNGGFSSKKDRARHEAKHDPKVMCEWVGEGGERCERKFSRADNMKDHVRRIHGRGQAKVTPQLRLPSPISAPNPDHDEVTFSSVRAMEAHPGTIGHMQQMVRTCGPACLSPPSPPLQTHYTQPLTW